MRRFPARLVNTNPNQTITKFFWIHNLKSSTTSFIMCLKTYFENLQREHNATSFEFVVDQARGDGRVSRPSCSASCASTCMTPSSSDDEDECLKQRPSFYTYSERLSSAPKCPLRSSDSAILDRRSQLSQLDEALKVLSMSLTDLSTED